MPKDIIDYSKTVIYKIVCRDLNINSVYVGSTTDFTRRKSKHKYSCNNPISKGYNYLLYKTIRENGGWDQYIMLEVEKFACSDGNEARTRERYWFEQLNANLNKQVPSRPKHEYKKQYDIDNKERNRIYAKNYRENKKNLLKLQEQHLNIL